MMRNMPFVLKNKLLATVVVAMGIIVFVAFISPINELGNQCEKLEYQLSTIHDVPAQLKQLQESQEVLQQLMGGKGTSGETHELVLDRISKYCSENKLSIREFPIPETTSSNDYEIELSRVTVAGSFDKLLKLVYEVEQRNRVGKVAGVEFKIERNKKARKNELVACIYVQHVKRKHHEG